jgi:hypothetical protein
MKAVYNTTFTNNADQILIFTFHHEPQGDNTGIAANYVSAYRNYRTVFLARMASDTGGAHFLGTILFGPIHYGVAYKDGSVATNGGAPGAWWPDNPIYGAGGTCDFAAADPYNWWPAQGTSLASEYSELSADKRAGHLAAFALANGIQAFLGELGTFEREPSSFVPGNPRGAGNRWDPTTTAPKASGVNAGGGPPFDRWPPDALTMARDITGSGGIQSKPAWIDHARLWIAAQLDGGGLPVVGVCCWFDEVGNFNRFTNSSQNSIDAMVQMATDPAFNA